MSFERDHYAVLGIAPDAGERAIKQAYRQLARRYHPDTSSDPDAAVRFREIQEAYELLIDPMQREAYDHWRHQEGVDQPLPLQLRVTPSQSALRCLNEDQILYVLLEVSPSGETEGKRLPLNLALVLDRSTSMHGGRLQQVKEAARDIVEKMGPEDVLSLVTFSDRAQVILPSRRNIEKAAARAAIYGIQSGGGTELLQGLQAGLQEVERWHSPEVNSHLILLTDGRTYGDEQDCLDTAHSAREKHIPLTMMGIGHNWNEKLLDEMADISHGVSIFVDSSAKITKAFQARMKSLGSIVAYNLRVTLHLAEGVEMREAYKVSPQIRRLRFSSDTLHLGSLEKQQPQAVMLELMLSCYSPGEHRLLQIAVEGDLPEKDHPPVRTHHEIVMPFHSDLDQRSPIPSDIVSALGKLTIFKMQERAMSEIEMGQIEPAVKRLKTLATRLLDIGETELARAALLEAGRLAQTGSLSTKGLKTIRYGTRGLTILPKEVRHD